jgi:hypothetical protein
MDSPPLRAPEIRTFSSVDRLALGTLEAALMQGARSGKMTSARLVRVVWES